MHAHRRLLTGVALFLVACGARTALVVTETFDASVDSGHPDAIDGNRDVRDAPVDLPLDRPKPDVLADCPDGGPTLVYVVTQQNELYTFFPPTLAFKKIGDIQCPASGPSPWSMAVDHIGNAYAVFYQSGELFKLNVGNAACSATTYQPNQLGWTTFGMGYTAESDGGERLFVAESQFVDASKGLGWIDTTTMKLQFVAPFSKSIQATELTGTADGRLFGYAADKTVGSHVYEIDKTTAAILSDDKLVVGGPNNAWAFAFWGGDFWVFTSPGGPSTVTKWDPLAKHESNVATLTSTIVGAGVSICVPQ